MSRQLLQHPFSPPLIVALVLWMLHYSYCCDEPVVCLFSGPSPDAPSMTLSSGEQLSSLNGSMLELGEALQGTGGAFSK